MKNYRLGKKAPVHTMHTMRCAIVMALHLDKLGTAPTNSDDFITAVDNVVGGDNNWGMDGNDNWGDCVECDTMHHLMLITANTSTIVVPTASQTLALYTALTGFNYTDATDIGTDENAMCQYMVNTGWNGYKADATAMLDPKNINHVKLAVQLFGGVRIGLNFPDSAEDQFDNNKPWDVVAGAQIEGGHDVLITGYEGDLWYVCSWGRGKQPMTMAFYNAYCDEAHGELYANWIKASGLSPSGFNAQQLTSDLNSLAVAGPVTP